MYNTMSIFQSRDRIRYKFQLEEDYVRIIDLEFAITHSQSKEDRLCCIKRYFEYIMRNPLLLFHHISFRTSTIKKIKKVQALMRVERVLAHQSYHNKHPSKRTIYEAELSKYVQPIETIVKELNLLLKSVR